MPELQVARCDSVRFTPDPSRVIAKPFLPGEEWYPDGTSRLQMMLERIAAMSDDEVTATLRATMRSFADRHRALDAILDDHFHIAASRPPHLGLQDADLSHERRRMIAVRRDQRRRPASAPALRGDDPPRHRHRRVRGARVAE